MEPADLLYSLLQDPEAMQKLSGMAAQLLGDADAPAEPAAPPRGTDAARIQLLHALRPFLSENTCAQIAHADRILSLARMTKTAVRQVLPPDGRTKEL